MSAEEPGPSASESFLPKQSTVGSAYGSTVELVNITSPKGLPVRGHRLTRYWPRAAILILGPAFISAYFVWIWQYCLRHVNPLGFARFDQVWIYYTWFIVGVFGLNLSRYGLAGVEATMLQTNFWQADNAMVVLMHSGNTWSGPGGWGKYLARLLTRKRTHTGRLWHTLAILSILPYIALPLSGLTIELTDGYVPSSKEPRVVGRTWDSFNRRKWKLPAQNSVVAWKNGLQPSLPGIGLAYTPKQINRDQFDFLSSVPNTLPQEGGAPELFLTSQANSPITGEAWGLRIGYDCSIVESASELTILNQKPVALGGSRNLNANGDAFEALRLWNSTAWSMSLFNSSSLESNNIWAYAELGLGGDYRGYNNDPTHNQSRPASFNLEGTDDIFEYVLWQVQLEAAYSELDDFNTTVGPSIAGLGRPIFQNSDGNYTTNRTFFAVNNTGYSEEYGADYFMQLANVSVLGNSISSVAAPIGVRCRRTSELGTAQLDWEDASFTNFKSSPSPFYDASGIDAPVPRFGNIAMSIMLGSYLEAFDSLRESPMEINSNSQWYPCFLQPQTLLRSVMRAHEVDALQLMYDGGGSMNGAYLNPNLTTTKRGKIIVPGAVPPVVPAVIFVIWSVGCAILGLMYGFRRRWSVSLDGYSFFRFGVDNAEEVRGEPQFSSVRPFDYYDKLAKLPGLVGDSQPGEEIGHVSLVRKRNIIDPRKPFA